MRCWTVLFLLAAIGSSQATLPDGFETLFLNRHASEEVEKAANDLAGLLERQFGTAPAVRRVPLWTGVRGIVIGPEPEHRSFDDNPLTDEILVERTHAGLFIFGSDNSSTCFAVYRFAEEFLGWRYYQPGKLGLERLDSSPEPPAVEGPAGVILHESADYFSRNLSSMGRGPGGPDWERWHGLRERFAYNHTLQRMLPPTEFDRNPDWFAKDAKGKPMRPPYYPKVHGYNDHPDLSKEAVRQWVIDGTLEEIEAATPFRREADEGDKEPVRASRLQQSPGILSVSISLGDSFVFGNFNEDYRWNPISYFRRWPDWSNHVFAYSNAVAEGIQRGLESGYWGDGKPPEIYIGTLAYLNWENVPDFEIHPSIVPYLTFDRSQWYDVEAKADDLRNVSAWNESKAPFLGTWDYLFGYGFIIPRSMVGIVSESIPELHKIGVRAYFSQVAPIWPFDGHTNWLLSRLLWNINLDSEALTDEYFREFYGPAAGSMRAFFDQAEDIWMKQPGSGWWLRHWKDPWQAGLWDEQDLARGRDLLEQAQRDIESGEFPDDGLEPRRFADRIEPTRKLFEFTQAFHLYQSLCWKLQTVAWESVSRTELLDGIALAQAAVSARQHMVESRDAALCETALARYASDLEWVFRYDSLGAGIATLSRNTLLKTGGLSRLTRDLEQLLAAWGDSQGLQLQPDLAGSWTPVLNDEDFSNVDNPRIWHRQFMDSQNMVEKARQDPPGFIVRNVRRGHLYQLFKAIPGDLYLGEVSVKTAQSLTGEVYIRLDFFNDRHELLAESRRSRIAPVDLFGTDQTVRALMRAPAEAAYGRLFIRFYEMDPGSEAALDSAEVLHLESRDP